MELHSIIESCEGFQWDAGNLLKSWLKHGVTQREAEEIFFNEPLLLYNDEKHSGHEDRFLAFGRTDAGRNLAAAFTVRKGWVRIVSARSMNKKEKAVYEKT